jgi:Leucine-rich repeat (LRR) protein
MKIILNENQYKLLFEFDDFSEQLDNLKRLIESGQEENIKLAFEIATGMESYIPNFKLETWYKEQYRELLDFLITNKYNNVLSKGHWFHTFLKNFLNVLNSDVITFSDKDLVKLPKGFQKFQNLHTLILSYNKFSEFPVVLCSMESLKRINLQHNQISEVPSCIANLKGLEYLDLRDNLLSEGDYESIGRLNPSAIIRFTDNIYILNNQIHNYYKQ